MHNERSRFLTFMLYVGHPFLYIPMVLLVIYSFNYSKLVPVWGGWSTDGIKYYLPPEVKKIISFCLQIAFINATFATLLGALAGLAMVRFGKFRSRTIFGGMLVAPLVMPEVITGLSLLIFFISLKELIGWPLERGFTTITIAHMIHSYILT